MPAPKYVQRIARLPHVFEILATHPQGMSLTELATEVGTTAAELHTDLLAFYSAELNPVLFGLSRPESIEFFSSASGGEVDPNDADRVRLIDDRPAEEIGVERVDAGELALVYTAATALAETEPGNADLAAAISVLTDAVFGDGAPEDSARSGGFVEQLRNAVAGRRKVRIEYSRSWYEGVIDRVIEPYRLVQTRRGWEVDAGPGDDHGPMRTYLAVNLRSVEVLDETFTPPAGIDQVIAEQRATERVRVRIPHSARWAADFHAERVQVVD